MCVCVCRVTRNRPLFNDCGRGSEGSDETLAKKKSHGEHSRAGRVRSPISVKVIVRSCIKSAVGPNDCTLEVALARQATMKTFVVSR